MKRALLFTGTLALLLLPAAAGQADPLDQVKGTEDWDRAGPEDPNEEWKDWYRYRLLWRLAQRDLRLQRRRTFSLSARLPRDRGSRASVRPAPPPPGRRAPAQPVIRPDPVERFNGEDLDEVGSEGSGPAAAVGGEGGASTPEKSGASSGTPEPPSWIKVPVERLNDKGQAIDEEGDRELERVTREKRKR